MKRFRANYSPIPLISCAHAHIPVFNSHPYTFTTLIFVFVLIFLSMAPRTRRAQRTVRNQAEGGLNGSNVSLEHATGPNTSSSVNVAGQDHIDNDQTPTNLMGGFETSCQA